MGKKYSLGWILLALFLIIYFYLYFYLNNSIFFDYDMPRVAFIVQDFLDKGTFLTSQTFFEESVWRNVPWGPSLVLFYSLFLKISASPLIVSYMLSFINLIAIVALVIFSWKYFSKEVGIIAGFMLAFNPYWLTYVRLIYQPSPITFFIPISMYLFFETTHGKNKWATILLPISWVILIQIYLPTYAFILTSFLAMIFFLRKINFKYLTAGILLSLILFIPSVKFYRDNPIYLARFSEAPSLFTPPEKTFLERFEKVSLSYLQIPIGGEFEHQTGYGQEDFVKRYALFYPALTITLSAVFVLSILWNLYKGFVKKDYKRLIILFWSITPLWSLMVLWVSDILPRYFLIAIPAVVVLVSLTLIDLTRISKFFYILPILTIFFLIRFGVAYNNFIDSYDYRNGRFIDVAETPYVFIKQAVGWVIDDAKKNSCDPILTNNPDNPNFDIWLETKYIWKYIYFRDLRSEVDNPCHYLIDFKNKIMDREVYSLKTIGQYTIFKFNPTKNQPSQTY